MNDQKDILENKPEEKPQAQWEKRGFAINQSVKQVCELTIEATKAEIASLKRKLEKLQYGS
jgi:hypothetical protein